VTTLKNKTKVIPSEVQFTFKYITYWMILIL